MEQRSTVEVAVERGQGGGVHHAHDVLAVEAPLEIRLHAEVEGRLERRTVSVTMRTPGDDEELAVGFLFAEGVLRSREQVADVAHCGAGLDGGMAGAMRVRLAPGCGVALQRLERHSFTSSSCGVCGKTSLDALWPAAEQPPIAAGRPVIDAALVHRLPQALRDAQAVFARTGGLHASALFDPQGGLVCLREDVGRHNALDKVIGAQLLAGRLPASDRVLLVSGRASFELVQKAAAAGIPILAAVGAPSSLAVELAARAGMTLLGFVRDGRFNVYTGGERIRWADGAATGPTASAAALPVGPG